MDMSNIKCNNNWSKINAMTLIELIVVIIIIGLLAGMLAPLATTLIKQAKIKAVKDSMDEIGKALLAYYKDTATLPADTGNVVTDFQKLESDTVSGWNGPYISRGRTIGGNPDYCYDPWKKLFVYDHTSGSLSCTITSYGPNRASGGGDDIVYTISAQSILRDKIKTTQDELQKISYALEKFLDQGYRITSGFNSADTNFTYFLNDSKLITDEWGNNYYWDTTKKTFYSYGPDGTSGGGDDIYPVGVP
jgi:general secretion pathway protein G